VELSSIAPCETGPRTARHSAPTQRRPNIQRHHSAPGWRNHGLMPQLTRRRSPDAPEECWHIYWGDIRAGTIAKRIGNPHDTAP
jgi:hypothetical protein